MSHAKRRFVLAVTLAEQGGVQEFLLRFARFLQQQGHEVTLVTGEGHWLVEQAKRQAIPLQQLTHMRRAILPWHDILAFFELRRLLQELNPDAIHLNSSKMGAIGSLAARSLGIRRIIYRIGGWVFLEPLSPLTRWFYVWIEKISARWKDTIICVHPGDAAVAKKEHIAPQQEIRVIPNGIDLTSFDTRLLSREESRTAFSLESTPFVFGTLANFFPAKGLLQYLDACAILHKEFPQVRFLLIGEGPERKALLAKRDMLGLNEAVILSGYKAQASRLLHAFDAFVLPSNKEGMSWALLEAMAAELPCVATDVGANHWLLTPEAGWLVPAHDPVFLAQRLKELLVRPEEAKRRGSLARTRIERDFPLQHTLQANEKALLD
ncbi:glycosyltransferase family 4 protein [Patescibacteria group bacterium]|nr:glycosyltransferase family 4 protein [Patescibacteria group bacterium]MBP9709682.1 glycosyltransferase family 4 protein [Patescibacteria group bacterium]